MEKEEIKLYVFTGDLILYRENTKISAKKIYLNYETSSKRQQNTRYIFKNHLYFYANNEKSEKNELREQFHLQ